MAWLLSKTDWITVAYKKSQSSQLWFLYLVQDWTQTGLQEHFGSRETIVTVDKIMKVNNDIISTDVGDIHFHFFVVSVLFFLESRVSIPVILLMETGKILVMCL